MSKGEAAFFPTSHISKRMPLSEVARHCTPQDCWVAIDGKVLDLTEFMDRHPGGPTSILNQAGKDATKIFYDIHKGVKIQQYLRQEAYLGELGIDEDLMTDSFWHTLRKARIAEIEEEIQQLKDVKVQEEGLLTEARMELVHRAGGGIPLSEVARHNKPHDLWIALNGSVYDLTDILKHHPEQRNAILALAGRDATPMWNKIPGRFPSATWMDFYMIPEALMGSVGPEPAVDPATQTLQQLRAELRRLQGPSEEEIQAAKAGAGRQSAAAAEAAKATEESRFPKLKEITAGKELPFFTRAEVAKHAGPLGGAAGTEPYMILHNKVYDLAPLLGAHPGGDEMLLTRAGTDATKEFELFEHSEKARVRRDQEMLVGEVVPAEQADYGAEVAAAAEGVGVHQEDSEWAVFLRHKAYDAVIAIAITYLVRSIKHRKPLSKFMYSRALRHLHLIMAAGIFGTLASAKAASHADGLLKKRLLAVHKQTGFAMFLALLLRMVVRLQSGIPPRFPGNKLVQLVETQSLRAFYAICFVLPVSGMAQEYFLKWAGGSDAQNDKRAQQAITVHKSVGKFFERVWMPFHLGYTTLYHFSQGRGVVRKVSPFI